MRWRPRTRGAAILAVLGLVPGVPWCAAENLVEPPPSTGPAAPSPVTSAIIVKPPAEPGAYANADELLSALEKADEGLRTLSADLVYDKTFATAGDQQTRKGKLYFQVLPATPGGGGEPGAPTRRFAIHFDTIVIGGRVDTDPRQYLFDGQWLVEKYPNDKRATKRQVVPPGETFDPLRIGEGPLPIPIGQKKRDILSRYDAQLLPPDDGLDPADTELNSFVRGAYQLKLVPRPERVAEDKFTEVRLWYRADAGSPAGGQGRLLPRMARTLNARSADAGEDGDESLVRLTGVVENADIPPGAINTEIPDGWDAQIIPFRESIPRARDARAPSDGEDGLGEQSPADQRPDDPKPGDPR